MGTPLFKFALLAAFFVLPLSLSAQSAQIGKFLFFSGEGKANSAIANETQRRSLSKEAAVMEAKGKIAFYIHELKTKNNVRVREAMAKNKRLEQRVQILLKGVQTVKSEWDEQDNCRVTVKIDRRFLLKKLNVHE